MIQPFKDNITLLKREYVPLHSGLARITIGNIEVTVPDHSFWRKFEQGWEPDTERIYQSIIKPGSIVLDIGAWIGPTLLFSLAYGAEKIIALEPNPESYSAVKEMIKLNPQITEKVTLFNQAVSDKPGTLKMGLVEGESDTSTFGIQGDDIKIQTTTISNLILDGEIDHIDLIKIDIEGAEALLIEDFQNLSSKAKQKIHLSMHVPFFPNSADKYALAESFRNYTIFDDRGKKINYETLKYRLVTEETHPDWGTKHGNFFELLLIAD